MPKTYNDLYLSVRRAMKAAGIESYNLEARLLVASCTGKTTEKLMADLSLYSNNEVEKKINDALQRRLTGEPIAYITGSWEFYGLPIQVDRNVLIPRMDTEILVDTAKSFLKGRKMNARVLDLCCGSGCIACAIAKEMPASRVVAADISLDAVSLCRRNVMMNDLSHRITCVDADATQAPPMLLGTFDLIVSNPPYIPTAEIQTLDPSVRDYEPSLALDGGEDGLDFYRVITDKWRSVLRNGGALMFEVGEGQADAVKRLMLNAGFLDVDTEKDTLGIDRVVYGLYI